MTDRIEPYDIIVAEVRRWANLGVHLEKGGVQLIGHTPQRGRLSYLHSLYRPLQVKNIKTLEEELGRTIPRFAYEFYLRANGCSLFSDSLNFYGHRTDYDRSLSAPRQPVSLLYPNAWERPRASNPDDFFFGWYGWDGAQIFLDNSGRISVCRRFDASARLYSWDSFEEMVESEMRRLPAHFDELGRKIVEDHPTTPYGN